MRKIDVVNFASTCAVTGAMQATGLISRESAEKTLFEEVNKFIKKYSLFWRIFGG